MAVYGLLPRMKARTTTILVILCLIANTELCDVSAWAGAGRVPSGGDDLPAGGHRYNIIIYI